MTDEQTNVSITRLGQRAPISGSLERGVAPGKKKATSLDRLYRVLQEWFAGAVAISGGMQEWKDARSLLPDNNPLIGASGIAGVWLNLAHGGSGLGHELRRGARAGRSDGWQGARDRRAAAWGWRACGTRTDPQRDPKLVAIIAAP